MKTSVWPLARFALTVVFVACCLLFLTLFALDLISINGFDSAKFSLDADTVLLTSVIILAILATLYLPIRLTKEPAPMRANQQPVEEVLSNPHVRRTILRLEIGGILAGVIALIFAVWGLFLANHQSKLAEQALRDQRISSAWQILAQRGEGNIGKDYALETLIKETNETISGLRLDCPTGERDFDWSPENNYLGMSFWGDVLDTPIYFGCKNPPYLVGLAAHGTKQSELQIKNSYLRHADLSQFSLQNAYLTEVSFDRSLLRDAVFKDTDVWGASFKNSLVSFTRLEGVALVGSTFEGATIEIDFSNSSIFYLDLKNVFSAHIRFHNSYLHSADFTNFDFTRNSVSFSEMPQFKDVSKIKDKRENNGEIRFLDGAYGGSREIYNISGAIFCKPNIQYGCANHLPQAFFDRAYYFVDNPPKGLQYLDSNIQLRRGCNRADKVETKWQGDHADLVNKLAQNFRLLDSDYCEDAGLNAVAELIAQGHLATD